MFRLHLSSWLTRKESRRWTLLLSFLLLLAAVAGGPRLWAWHELCQGRAELEQFHTEKALRHLNACLRIWPHHVTAHLLAARAARRLDDYEGAEEHLRQAQQQQTRPSDEVVLEWALHRAALGNLKQTEAYLLPLTRVDAEEGFLACEALAQGYQRTYRISQAALLLEAWLKRRPDDIRALLLRGRLGSQTEGLPQALLDYQRVLELEPECEEAQRGLASCLSAGSRWNEAIPYWEELYRRSPADVEIRVNLALCLGHLGQEEQALQLLRAVVQECPNHLVALRGLGKILLQQQQPAEAETWLRRALRAEPQDYRSHWLLSGALQQQGKTVEADQQLDRARQLERRWQRLINITSKELARRPHDAALQAELGALLLDLGYEEAGRNWLLSALQEDPNCTVARAALERSNQNRAANDREQNGPIR